MRLSFSILALTILAALALSSCGNPVRHDNATSEQASAGEVTMELPPPKPFRPTEPEQPAETATVLKPAEAPVVATPVPAEKVEVAAKTAEPSPKEKPAKPKKQEPAAPSATPTRAETGAKGKTDADQLRLLPARVPLADAQVARTIERIGFPCGSVTSSNRVENEGGEAVYKITCSSGESYQGTMRSGRLFFRQWTGKLTRD